MLLKKTALEMEADAIQELMAGGTLTNMSPGGRVRSIISAMSKQNGHVMDALDANTAMGFVTSASGYFLDLWGQIVGVDRQDAYACFILKEDRSLKFYVTTGVLKDYIPSGVVSSGTTVQTSSAGVEYVIAEDTPFPDDATEVYLSATASGTGSGYRVGPNMLTTNSLGDPNILCTNEKSVSNGADSENDANYRYRILNHWASRATANITAVRLAALSTPGVADVVIKRHFQGPGTIDILLTPTGNRITDSMVIAAEARVSRISAAGDYAVVRGPRYVPITIDTQISFTEDTPDADKADIRGDVRASQIDYLDDIPIGGRLIMQELRARTQETSNRILDHQILCLGINGRAQLLRNWQLFEDELLILDPDTETPIKVT